MDWLVTHETPAAEIFRYCRNTVKLVHALSLRGLGLMKTTAETGETHALKTTITQYIVH